MTIKKFIFFHPLHHCNKEHYGNRMIFFLNLNKSLLFPPCCSVTQSCPTLCDPMECSTPGLPVPHHLPKLAQVHVHCIGDAIQPSHPLMPSSPSAFNLSQHQGLFKWVGCLHWEKQLQKWRKSNEFQRDKCVLAELTTLGGEKWHFTDILNNTVILESWKLLGHFQQERRWEGLEEMTLLLWGEE